ncbi:MAG: TonB-dependent receptor plug, partial [Bryobacterales bacterium]|nr:TonB-dependent receptor plug [Bryobacterales bacterium]
MKNRASFAMVFAGVISCLALSPANVLAQGYGAIVGTITDASGAAIPAAKVAVKNPGTGFSRIVNANAEGYYVIPSLPPSSYSLSFESAGFTPYQQNNVTLLADQ